MSQKLNAAMAVIGIDIGKNSLHIVGRDHRGAIALRQKWSRGQVETRSPTCHRDRYGGLRWRPSSQRQAPNAWPRRPPDAGETKYVRPYSKGQKNEFRDAEAIAEAVQRPATKFVATKTADQLDLQALHRVRDRLVSQRTGVINQIRAFPLERGIGVRQGLHARG
jgi:transposase